MTAQILQLPALPAALPIFFNAALTATRKPAGKIELPRLQVQVPAVRIERARLSAYDRLLGFDDVDTLPLTYPHVLGSALHMHLMARPQFPLPMLGLVHLRNTIEQPRAIGIDETLDLCVSLSDSRESQQGLEFDLLTEFSGAAGEIRWRGVSTYLYRIRRERPARARPAPDAEIPLSQYLSLNAPADIGRRYAKVSRDYNPIHLYALSAKLFGFKRAIATGMWSAAKVLALLQAQSKTTPTRYEFQFKQPLLLPGRAVLRFERDAGGLCFALIGSSAGRLHLSGTLA